jgi:hypothetical protein
MSCVRPPGRAGGGDHMRKLTIGDGCALGIVLGAIISATAGCGGVKIRQVTPQNPYEEGLRFYRPHPYLWVTKDKSGGLQGSIIWLPDKSQEYVATAKSGLGSAESRLTLEDGWNLTGFSESRESPTAAMITALTGSLQDITKVLPAANREELRPGLYVFTFDDKTGLVSGLKPVFQFE